MPFAIINQQTLHYLVEGAVTAPAVVFINSLGNSLHLWDGVLPQLDGDLRLIRYDKRGHGLSDTPPAPYTIRDHTTDLVGLLDHLNIAKATLIGISVGGLIAMDCALQYPARVQALVLCDTAPKISIAELWTERIETLRQHGMAYMAETIIARWYTATFAARHPAEYSGYRNLLLRAPLEGYIGTCAALRDADLRDAVHAITAKTLVICGEEDVVTPPAAGQALAAALPNARFSLITNAAHLPPIEQPHVVAALIHHFLVAL